MSRDRLFRWAPLLPLLLAFSFNFNVLGNDFGWDDESIILNIQSPERWSNLFLPSASGIPEFDTSSSYFRPLVWISYLIDKSIWGETPAGFHLSVWLFHLLNTALVFFLARALLEDQANKDKVEENNKAEAKAEVEEKKKDEDKGKRTSAYFLNLNLNLNLSLILILFPLLVSSLFAVHPIHAEAVAWIAGRNDVFCTTFLLASFLFYVRFHRTEKMGWYGLSMIGFSLALLTKEIAVGMVLIFAAYEYLSSKDRSRKFLKRLMTRGFFPLLILGAYFWMRSGKLARPFGETTVSGLVTHSSASEVSEMIVATGLYIKMMFFPFPHNPLITTLPDSLPFVLLYGLMTIVCLGLLIRAFIYRELLLCVGLTWTFVLLAPAVFLSVLDVAVIPAAERYTYAPSAGFLMALSWTILKVFERLPEISGWSQQKTGWGVGFVVVVLIIGLGSVTWNRNLVWFNQLTFWKVAMAKAPDAGLPYRELGTQYYHKDQYAEAEKLYLLAVAKDDPAIGPKHPDLPKSLFNLAVLYGKQRRYTEAEPLYRRTLAIEESVMNPSHPGLAGIIYNLADILKKQSRFGEAEPLYRRALAIREKAYGSNHRGVAACLQSLADIKYAQEDYVQAEALYGRTLEILEEVFGAEDPFLIKPLYSLASLYHRQGRYTEAEPLYKRVLELSKKTIWEKNPFAFRTLLRLAQLYHVLGKFMEAESRYQESLAMRERVFGPEHPVIVENLERYAALLRETDREVEAAEMERRARDIRKRKIKG